MAMRDTCLKLAILKLRPAGVEPATVRLEGGCSVQLSYGRLAYRYPNSTPPQMQRVTDDTPKSGPVPV